MLLDGLPLEEVPVARQLALGGMPAVRRALAEAHSAPGSPPRPGTTGAGLVELAERLASPVREAVWLDRAEAAVAMLEQISLRELRSTVTGAAPRDENGRELLQRLREALSARLERLHAAWERDVTRALDENRVLQALRLSARPPEPSARFPASLVARLASSAGAAMSEETPVERWQALLEAVVASPVRRLVKPAGIPKDPELRRAAAKEAGRIPALAGLLGLSMPPPPGPPVPPPPAARRDHLARTPVRTIETPGSEAPAPEAPAPETPGSETPGSETPASEAPAPLPGPEQLPSSDAVEDAALTHDAPDLDALESSPVGSIEAGQIGSIEAGQVGSVTP